MNHRLGRPRARARLYGLASIVALTVASGCASMNEEECLTADWEMIGYEDGAAGQPGVRIAQHRKACADYGITPNMAAYRRGRDQGLAEYCQPERAYRLGLQGHKYAGACPPEVADQFTEAYEAGRQIYVLERSIRQTESQIRHRERQLLELRTTLRALELELVDGDTSKDRRVELVLETHQLNQRQSTLQSEIVQLQHQAQWKRGELQHLKAGHLHTW